MHGSLRSERAVYNSGVHRWIPRQVFLKLRQRDEGAVNGDTFNVREDAHRQGVEAEITTYVQKHPTFGHNLFGESQRSGLEPAFKADSASDVVCRVNHQMHTSTVMNLQAPAEKGGCQPLENSSLSAKMGQAPAKPQQKFGLPSVAIPHRGICSALVNRLSIATNHEFGESGAVILRIKSAAKT